MPGTDSALFADSVHSPIPSSTPESDSNRALAVMIQNHSELVLCLASETFLITASAQASELMIEPDSGAGAESAPSPIPSSGRL